MSEKSAREILADNEAMFEERRRVLQPLAEKDPYRHPPNRRTWWDWREIQRRQQAEHWLHEDATRAMHKRLALAPSLDVFLALIEGQSVPEDRFDPEAIRRYRLR